MGFIWLRMGSIVASCEHNNEPLGSIKGGEFLDQMSNCQLLKDSAPRSSLVISVLVT
jgi:hypothetical protein